MGSDFCKKKTVVLADVVIETFRQQRDLVSVLALNESLHLLVSTNVLTSVSAHKAPSVFTRSAGFHTASTLTRRPTRHSLDVRSRHEAAFDYDRLVS